MVREVAVTFLNNGGSSELGTRRKTKHSCCKTFRVLLQQQQLGTTLQPCSTRREWTAKTLECGRPHKQHGLRLFTIQPQPKGLKLTVFKCFNWSPIARSRSCRSTSLYAKFIIREGLEACDCEIESQTSEQ